MQFPQTMVLSALVVLIPAIHGAASDTAPNKGRWVDEAATAIAKAGANRAELERAVEQTPSVQRDAMRFLIAYMPERDLRSLSAEFLLANHRLAFQAWQQAPWKDSVDEDLFFNYVLPYASINEGRDAWRADFRERFLPLIADAKSPSEAAIILNHQVFPLLKVRYSTQRKRADQAPFESIRSGLASCTGLSILLIDACRSVGVPARFVGTPLWADGSGNHSWVEVWDQGWHHTGAAEPQAQLDRVWFSGRARKAKRDDPLHAIYAVRYQHTPRTFPLVWDTSIDYVYAVNVTDRYTASPSKLADGYASLNCRCIDAEGERIQAAVQLRDSQGKIVAKGQTRDERFDRNDHLVLSAPVAETCVLTATDSRRRFQFSERRITFRADMDTLTLQATKIEKPADESQPKPVSSPAAGKAPKQQGGARIGASKDPVGAADDPMAPLRKAATAGDFSLDQIAEAAWSKVALNKAQAREARKLLWNAQKNMLSRERAAEMEAREIVVGNLKMPFYYKVFGEKPAAGRPLYISMHGGGGAPPRVNDQQWENQKRLYTIPEGVYLAPRAPTNTWNLWHQSHVDGMIRRLIENLIVFEQVDPDRVYLMGYSAGGDGVFQLAPRMADSFASAAMMAGHPNETSPLGIRNLPFTIHMGGQDNAYGRNKVAAEWAQKLAALRKDDPEGYLHWVKIYPGKGHWMDREDAAALPWMAKHQRRLTPSRIVWKQDDVTHHRFYWLAVPKGQEKARGEIRAEQEGQTISLELGDVRQIIVRFREPWLDLDKPVVIRIGDERVHQGVVPRTIATIAKTLAERNDPRAVFTAELRIER